MLEIDSRKRTQALGFWQYQKRRILEYGTQLSHHDGQSSCFYTSLAFYDTVPQFIRLDIEKEDLAEIRKKIASVNGTFIELSRTNNINFLDNTAPVNGSINSSGYVSL